MLKPTHHIIRTNVLCSIFTKEIPFRYPNILSKSEISQKQITIHVLRELLLHSLKKMKTEVLHIHIFNIFLQIPLTFQL